MKQKYPQIVHFFNANRVHLGPLTIKDFYFKYKEFSQGFVLINATKESRKVYLSVINKCNIDCYLFCDSISTLLGEDKFEWQKSLIFLHGIPYLECVKLVKHGCRNVHWICWGESVKPSKGLISFIFCPIKSLLLRKLTGIVTLMQPDLESLKKYYNVRHIECIPYFPYVNEHNTPISYAEEDAVFNKVLLGNNSGCIDDYMNSLDLLKKFGSNMEVACLLNYNLKKDDKFLMLKDIGESYFGTHFKIIENLMSQSEYIDFLRTYDVYVSGKKNQTGLGAIYRMLALGKKVYLAGNNFTWIKQIGCKIGNVSDINNLSFDDFIQPYSLQIRRYNHERIVGFLNNGVEEKWRNYIVRNL